jgi:hypothetical protein
MIDIGYYELISSFVSSVPLQVVCYEDHIGLCVYDVKIYVCIWKTLLWITGKIVYI